MLRVRTLRFLAITLALATSAHSAVLRSPQVPISGNALATFFASQGESIDPATQQIVLPPVALLNVGLPSGLQLISRRALGSGALDLYNAAAASPAQYMILPASASVPGWFTMTTAQTSPMRLIVNLFDEQNSFQGSTTYLAGPPDPFNLAFAYEGPTGLRYSQDARNPSGLPRLLAFAGTGGNLGNVWLCVEDGSTGTGDFADAVFLILGIAPVPVQHTSWGTLKQRFR